MNTNTVVGSLVAALIIGGFIGWGINEGAHNAPAKVVTSSLATTSPEWKIENAMSAAPENIGNDATVLDIGADGKIVELRKGTNGWTCLPDMPMSPGNDPICVDGMGMKWFEAYMSQKAPRLAQDGIGYMLQGGSDASNVDPFAMAPKPGEDWVTAPPHIMVFPKGGSLDPKVYGTTPGSHPWIMYSGTPYQHLMVPVQ